MLSNPVRPNGSPSLHGAYGAWKVEDMLPPAEAIAQNSMVGGLPKIGPIAIHGVDGLVLGRDVASAATRHGRNVAGAATREGTAVKSVT